MPTGVIRQSDSIARQKAEAQFVALWSGVPLNRRPAVSPTPLEDRPPEAGGSQIRQAQVRRGLIGFKQRPADGTR